MAPSIFHLPSRFRGAVIGGFLPAACWHFVARCVYTGVTSPAFATAAGFRQKPAVFYLLAVVRPVVIEARGKLSWKLAMALARMRVCRPNFSASSAPLAIS